MGSNNMDIKSKDKIAIIDANNFYVSCERLFNPSLEKKETVVLSNNDGCIIARSQEVKDIGIRMGQPLFQLEETTRDKIKKFSSNYALYGDISDRIATILKRLVKRVEIYSIDESFLDLSDIPEDKILTEIKLIKQTIQTLTGIPVSIGVAPNKTLAKLCNHISKTDGNFEGSCSYWDMDRNVIYNLQVDEVCGIGRRYKKKLSEIGVLTVRDFMNLQPTVVRSLLSVTGLRTWYELSEVLCHPISTDFKKPRMITCSRSFGFPQSDMMQIKNAYFNFLESCHRKLRTENLATNEVFVFAQTNRFSDNYFVWSKSITLSKQSDDLDDIWNQVSPHLEGIPFRIYSKCGVVLNSLKPKNIVQGKIFSEDFKILEKPEVKFQWWNTRRNFLSPEYTTNWNDLPLAF